MITKEFLTAGRATFTLENTQTEKHQTYRVKRGKPSEQYPNPALFVYALSGPDNERSYSYMGVLDERTLSLRLTRRSTFAQDDIRVLGFNFVARCVISGRPDSDKVKIHHEGHCGRCGRLLTHPDSIETGIGPECGKHIHPGYHSTPVKAVASGQLRLV